MSAARSFAFLAFAALSFTCGGDAAKQQGEACVATSQCAQGLLCDQVTRVCSMMGMQIDAPVPVDASTVDGPTTDGPTVDAPMIDAPVIDAPVIDAPIDAAIDAPEIDAPP